MLIGKTEKYVLDKDDAVYKYKSQKSCPYDVTILSYKLLLRDYKSLATTEKVEKAQALNWPMFVGQITLIFESTMYTLEKWTC